MIIGLLNIRYSSQPRSHFPLVDHDTTKCVAVMVAKPAAGLLNSAGSIFKPNFFYARTIVLDLTYQAVMSDLAARTRRLIAS